MKLTIVDHLDQLRDHFGPKPWPVGTRKYAFHLTLEDAPQIGDAARAAHQVLAPVASLRPVPVPWLHLTMTGLGPADDVTGDQLAAIAEPVFDHWAGLVPAQLTYDQLLLAHESVMLTARDHDWLHELASVQRRAVDEVLGARTWGRLWPHSSLLYATGPTSAATVLDALQPLSEQLPDALTVRPVLTLMELGRDTGNYEWTVVRRAGC